MTQKEWKKAKSIKGLLNWKPFNFARKYFPLCKLGKIVVLHHKNPDCTNYEEWNVNELVPMFQWCHSRLHSHSPENKKKKSDAQTGKVSPMKGKRHTEETKKRISIKNKNQGKGRIVSEETREKISKSGIGRIPWNKGKNMPEESRVKMSIAKKGKPSHRRGVMLSEETKKKIADAKRKNNLVVGY